MTDRSSEEGPVAWLRSAILARKATAEAATQAPWEAEGDDETDDEVWIDLDDDSAIRLVILRGPESHENMLHVAANDPQDTAARCEAELAILDEHPAFADDPAHCARCQNWLYAVPAPWPCTTIRALAQGYRRWPGFPAAFADLDLHAG